MDYAALIRDAWTMTWRYRFLWVLGLFAGAGLGPAPLARGQTPMQYRLDGRDLDALGPGVGRELDGLGATIVQNLGLILAIGAALLLVGLALLAVSLVAQGGLAQATAALARDRRVSAGEAWRVGLRLFWRYLGLWVLVGAIVLVVAAVVAAVFGLGVFVASLGGTAVRVTFGVLGVLLGIGLALAAIPAGVAASIVVAYAQRAIAVEDVGPIDGLRAGWSLLRAKPGASLVVWLISAVLAAGAGLALGLVAVLLVALLVAVGAAIWMAAPGIGPATITYAAAAVLLAVGVLWGLGGIANTYFWSYWTSAYLRLTGRLT